MRGDKNREGLAEIANPAMVEFATHSNYPFRPFGDGVHAGRKMKPQSPFKALANVLQGFFISGPARIAYVRGGPSGLNRSKSCFISWGRRKKVSKLKSGIRNLPLFPSISVSEFFQTSMESGKECFARCVWRGGDREWEILERVL